MVDTLVDAETRRGVGSKAVADCLYLFGVVAEFEQGTVDKAVAAVVELHGAVGEHYIVGTEQFVHQVDVGHIVVVGVVVDGAEIVPVAEVVEEFLYGIVVEDVPKEGVADDDEGGVALGSGVAQRHVDILVACGGDMEHLVEQLVEVGIGLAGAAIVGFAQRDGTDGGAEGLHIAHDGVESVGAGDTAPVGAGLGEEEVGSVSIEAVEAVADVHTTETVEAVPSTVVVVGTIDTLFHTVVAGLGAWCRQVLWVDTLFAGQEGKEQMYPLFLEDVLQFGEAAHALEKDIALFVAGDKEAVGIEVIEATGIVFVYKPRLKEIVILSDDYRARVGGAVVGRPKILVVETDGRLTEAVMVFDIAVHLLLPFASHKSREGKLRLLGTDVGTLEWLDLDEMGSSLQDGEQEERHGDKAEYLRSFIQCLNA